MITLEILLLVLLSYLTGATPSAVWIGKIFYNTDVREYGSGNAGATNTFRVLGIRAGIPVLILDILKGSLAVLYIYLIPDLSSFSLELVFEHKLAFGISAVVGHLFPVYTGFRGGKGIATMLGVLIALHPLAAFFSFCIFLFVFFISRYVSLASIVASIAFPFFIMFLAITKKILKISLIQEKNVNLAFTLKKDDKLFLIGSYICLFCYFFFSNWTYREIFLILTIPYLLNAYKDTKFYNLLSGLIILRYIFLFIYSYGNINIPILYVDNERIFPTTLILIFIRLYRKF